MQRARRYRIVGLALGAVFAGFIALTACSNYAEGERCELGNGNEDCTSGLVCTPKARLAAPYNVSDRCCPPDLATATAVACVQPQAGFGADSAPPEETGPAPDATTVDAAETSAPVEAGPDVVDAAEGGG
jgi:hypothetical protein